MTNKREELNISRNLTKSKFTMVSNGILTDATISFGAKGLLSLMLSRPDTWKFYKSELVKNSSDTEYALTKLLKELTAANYLFRFSKANKGKGAGFTWIWIFKDEPLTPDEIDSIKKEYNLVKSMPLNYTADSTTSLINDDSCLGVHSNTDFNNNTNLNNNTEHVTCCNFEKTEKKTTLGTNPKGYPRKDEWEKFLNLNLIGIDYTLAIENAIKKLLKT
ncbi:MAG: hypothetical protein ACRC6U_09075, partial [Fusobacteriaceae bacterium]